MKHFAALKRFARNEEGAQVVEYALIIAVVSIVLVIALSSLDGRQFNSLIARVTNCLISNTCA